MRRGLIIVVVVLLVLAAVVAAIGLRPPTPTAGTAGSPAASAGTPSGGARATLAPSGGASTSGAANTFTNPVIDRDFPDPAAEAALVAERLHGRAVLVPDAGHYPHAEFPERTTPPILDFLREVVGLPGA